MLVVGRTIFVETTTRVGVAAARAAAVALALGRSCGRSRGTSPEIGAFAGESDYESPSA
jgi:hypothetical protein